MQGKVAAEAVDRGELEKIAVPVYHGPGSLLGQLSYCTLILTLSKNTAGFIYALSSLNYPTIMARAAKV